MGTPRQLVQFSFAGGLDESQAEEVLEPTTAFTRLENLRQNNYGSAEKRRGFNQTGVNRLDGTSRTAGLRCFAHRDQVCVIDDTPQLEAWSTAADAWIPRGRVSEATYSRLAAPTIGASNSSAEDCVYVNGYLVTVYASVGIVGSTDYQYASVLDTTTGAVVRGPDLIESAPSGTSARARVAKYGNYAISAWSAPGATELRLRYLDCTSSTSVAAGWQFLANVAAFTGLGIAWDIANLLADDAIALAYCVTSAGVNIIRVDTYTISGVTHTVDLSIVNPLVTGLGLSENSSVLWVAWKDATHGQVKTCGLDPSNVSATALASTSVVIVTAFTQNTVHVVARSSTTAAVYASGGLDAIPHYGILAIGVKIVAGATATDGTLNQIGGSTIVSRPFLRGSRIYAHTVPSSLVGTVPDNIVLCDVTLDFTSGAPVTYLRPVCAPTVRGLGAQNRCQSGRTTPLTSTTYAYAGIENAELGMYATAMWSYDFADPNRWQVARVGGATYLGGGLLGIYDGLRVFEAGFLAAPPRPTTDNTSGTGLTLTNGRVFVAVYEDVDADGNVHVSGVSLPSTPISGAQANKVLKVTVVPLSMTARGNVTGQGAHSLRIALYATLDSANGQAPFYRVGDINNDPSVATLVFSDTMTDATLATKPLLYGSGVLPGTNGSSQDHRAPPGLPFVAAYNGMLVGATGSEVWYSSQPVSGEGRWFSPVFSVETDEEATGICVQDSTLVVLTKSGAWITSGDPPSDNAQQGGLIAPRKLPTDIGCTNATSIVTTVSGTFFQSDKGLALLSRGLTISFVGAKVQRTLGAYPVISSAVVDTGDQLVRFSLTASRTSGVVDASGRDLVYDLTLQQWVSVDRRYGSVTDQAAQDTCMATFDGATRFCWLATNGVLYVEHLASEESDLGISRTDGSVDITMAAETSWVKLGGIQGKQLLNRVLFLERTVSNHEVRLALAYDYSTTFQTARAWTTPEINSLLADGWPITQLQHNPHDDAECQAVRIQLVGAFVESEAWARASGIGGTWLALTLDITPREGAADLPAEAA